MYIVSGFAAPTTRRLPSELNITDIGDALSMLCIILRQLPVFQFHKRTVSSRKPVEATNVTGKQICM